MNDSSRAAPPRFDSLTCIALAAGLAMGNVVTALAERAATSSMALPAAFVFVISCSAAVVCALASVPRPRWTAPATGDYRVSLDYANDHGPINTGITAAVKMLRVHCGGSDEQRLPIVMPHSVRAQPSTWGRFTATAGAACQFNLDDGFNMSYLAHFAHYTGGAGGSAGPLNQADVHDLLIAPLTTGHGTP